MYVCRGSRKLLNLQSYYIDDSWARLSQQVLLASLSSSKDLYGAAFSAEARSGGCAAAFKGRSCDRTASEDLRLEDEVNSSWLLHEQE